ncbi:hypothetical protein CU254_41950 (plasmid) [Amycolatopsis sp. AA4]|nr:hypothetical protein CU254_41950 [Amycolatopsis sp. AA4]
MNEKSLWAHGDVHWWGPIECDDLFLKFETSAHLNDGIPDATPDEVVAHINECDTCRDLDMRVSLDSDGLHTVENVA